MRSMLYAIVTSALAFGLACGTAQAADTAAKPTTTQQSRMKTCNADAKAQKLKGTERKSFMSQCLKGK